MANKDKKDELQVDESKVGLPHDPPMEATQEAPAITPVTVSDILQTVPPITPTKEAAPQPSQDVSPSRPPAEPIQIADPPRTHEAAPQPSQDPGTPAPPFEPQPVDISMSKPPAGPVDMGFSPHAPAVLPTMPAPQLSTPAVLPQPPDFSPGKPAVLPAPPAFEPVLTTPAGLKDIPVVPSVPAVLPNPPAFVPGVNAKLPDPPAVVPSKPAGLPPPPGFAPQPNAVLPPMPAPPPQPNAVLPPMPAPPPSAPAILPPMPAPPPGIPAVLPPPPAFIPNANATLPPMPAPPPGSPAILPPPPAFAPQPPANLPPPPAFAAQPNANLPKPPAFAPQPNAVLPGPPGFNQPAPHAPNGIVEPAKDRLGKLDLIDGAVKEALRLILPFGESGGGAPGSHAGDPILYAKNLKRLGQQVGPFGLSQFSALQFVLFAMNVNGRIWNPNTLAPPPGAINWIPAAVDDFVTHEDLTEAELTNPAIAGAVQQDAQPLLNDSGNPYSADNPYTQGNAGTFFSITGMVDKATGKGTDPASARVLANSDLSQGITDASTTGPLLPIQKGNIASLYSDSLITLGPNGPRVQIPLNTRVPTNQGLPGSGDKLAKAYYSSGIVPAGFDNETNGFIRTQIRKVDPNTKVDDDDAYVPLSFMDLRPLGGTNEVRTVYFRPFITNLTEELAPEWNKQNFFGRTDAVATYMATGRTINLGFQVHAFAPEDLELIYQKKAWLASMCYPTYDKDILFKAGPVIRLRVGDLLKTTGGFGLPGIIESLSFDFNDTVWELQKGNKVPMGFKVSMSFLVLHERPIGIGVDGQFGGIGKIDPGTGKWSPPQSSDNSKAQNAPEMDANAVDSFAGGTGNKLNTYSKK